jgi:hypothetical protein
MMDICLIEPNGMSRYRMRDEWLKDVPVLKTVVVFIPSEVKVRIFEKFFNDL